MARDYKNVGGKKKGESDRAGHVLSFLTGLSIGLLVAFAVFLYQYRMFLDNDSMAAEPAPRPAPQPAVPQPGDEDATFDTPAPTFDFYRILPEREVNISEWVADEPPAAAIPAPDAEPAPGSADTDLLVLQVGSFKNYEAADEVKAKLALLGISAEIQRVVINGQDIRHRVRIGPYSNRETFEETRRQLIANDLNFMVLRLKVDETAQTRG